MKWESQDIKCMYNKQQFDQYTYHFLYRYEQSKGKKEKKRKKKAKAPEMPAVFIPRFRDHG